MAGENTTPDPETPTVKSMSGFDEGTVLPDGSVIKGSYDEDGKLVGWHKEESASGGAK